MLRRLSGSKRNKVRGGGRKVLRKELHNMTASASLNTVSLGLCNQGRQYEKVMQTYNPESWKETPDLNAKDIIIMDLKHVGSEVLTAAVLSSRIKSCVVG
jgi:hypothetical protein